MSQEKLESKELTSQLLDKLDFSFVISVDDKPMFYTKTYKKAIKLIRSIYNSLSDPQYTNCLDKNSKNRYTMVRRYKWYAFSIYETYRTFSIHKIRKIGQS